LADDKVAQLLYETTIRELENEKERRKNIETKAQRFVIFSGILFSVVSTYFLGFFETFDKIYLIIFIISLIGLAVSIFFFTYTLKTYNFKYFDVEKLIIFAQDYEYDGLIKRLTGTFSEYIIERRDINNRKVKLLDIGCLFFFISLALMVSGIFFFMFNV